MEIRCHELQLLEGANASFVDCEGPDGPDRE